VDTEDLVADDGSYWKAIKTLYEFFPKLERIPSFDLVIKSVNTVNGPTFVVASQKEEVFGILDLICHKEANDFEVLLSTIDVITQKQVVRLWWETADLKNSEQVDELAMDITCDDEWWIQLYKIRLPNKYLLGFLNEHLNLLLCEINWLDSEVGSIRLDIVSHFQERVNDGV